MVFTSFVTKTVNSLEERTGEQYPYRVVSQPNTFKRCVNISMDFGSLKNLGYLV